MEEKQVSVTAVFSAYLRGFHAIHESPAIFNDTMAMPLIPPERLALIEGGLFALLARQRAGSGASRAAEAAGSAWDGLLAFMRGMPSAVHVLSRSAFAEDELEKALACGLSQYVILGAGLDSYAARLGATRPGLRVFELDYPETQALKRERMRLVAPEAESRTHYLSIDFRSEGLSRLLGLKSFDPAAPAFFSWLGVSMYLEKSAVKETLASVSAIAAKGSLLAFDFLDEEAFAPRCATGRASPMVEWAAAAGEPMLSGYGPEEMADVLGSSGLAVERMLGPEAIDAEFVRGRNPAYRACEHARFAVCRVA